MKKRNYFLVLFLLVILEVACIIMAFVKPMQIYGIVCSIVNLVSIGLVVDEYIDRKSKLIKVFANCKVCSIKSYGRHKYIITVINHKQYYDKMQSLILNHSYGKINEILEAYDKLSNNNENWRIETNTKNEIIWIIPARLWPKTYLKDKFRKICDFFDKK